MSERKRGISLLEPYAEMSDRELVEVYNSDWIHKILKFFGFEEDIKLNELKEVSEE